MASKSEIPAQAGAPDGAPPAPPNLRFFSTTWVDRGPVYWSLRVIFSLGVLLVAAGLALLYRFGLQGLSIGDGSRLLSLLGTVGVGICSAVAAGRTWASLERERKSRDGVVIRKSRRTRAAEAAEAAAEVEKRGDGGPSQTPIMVLGAVGWLLAHFAHSFVEAPHESALRRGHQRELARRQAKVRAVKKRGGGAKRGKR
jgi:hypothetical protein